MLHEVRAQHDLKAKRRSVSAFLWVVRGNQRDQRCLGHDLIHLLQKLAFAGFLDVQTQAEGCLFYDEGFSSMWFAADTQS